MFLRLCRSSSNAQAVMQSFRAKIQILLAHILHDFCDDGAVLRVSLANNCNFSPIARSHNGKIPPCPSICLFDECAARFVDLLPFPFHSSQFLTALLPTKRIFGRMMRTACHGPFDSSFWPAMILFSVRLAVSGSYSRVVANVRIFRPSSAAMVTVGPFGNHAILAHGSIHSLEME